MGNKTTVEKTFFFFFYVGKKELISLV